MELPEPATALSPLDAGRAPAPRALPWVVPGDWDGFFSLFFSTLPDLLLIVVLGPLCGFTVEFVTRQILPGLAFSIFIGNLFYAWQARRLAQQTGRDDVTAIPFGVNTPTVFAYIFLIMLPVFRSTHDPRLTWEVGLFACFLSGVVQTAGAFCTDWLRRTTPRAALLCPLAGIGLAYLCLGFILRVFQTPEIALVPSVILLTLYGSRLRLPGRFPAVLFCLLAGAFLTFVLKAAHLYRLPLPAPYTASGFYLPHPADLFRFLSQDQGWRYLSDIIPMSLLDLLVSLQVLESVEVAGDDYRTVPSLLMNGVATLAASFFGSAFPTIPYFGHMGFKAMGARSGYSFLNGIAMMLVCITGLVPIVLRFIPVEVVAIIVVWFGLVMVGQAFTEIPKTHALAVAFGLIPILAGWALQIVETALHTAGSGLVETAAHFGDELPIYGLIALSQGAVLTSMLWAAALAYIVDRRFVPAAGWMAVGAVLSGVGLIHAFRLTPAGVENHLGLGVAPEFMWSYAVAALFLVGCHYYQRYAKDTEPVLAE
jgi:AGZA family xanthine/uracil permease-like MFS transporter